MIGIALIALAAASNAVAATSVTPPAYVAGPTLEQMLPFLGAAGAALGTLSVYAYKVGARVNAQTTGLENLTNSVGELKALMLEELGCASRERHDFRQQLQTIAEGQAIRDTHYKYLKESVDGLNDTIKRASTLDWGRLTRSGGESGGL